MNKMRIWRQKVTRGKSKKHDIGIRKCVVTGEKYNQEELLKFILNPKGVVVLDINRKLPGRGMWVFPTRNNLEKVASGNYFSRSAHGNVEITSDFLYTVETKIIDYLTGILSLGRKFGVVVTGFEKVRQGIGDETVSVLVQAIDGSDRQGQKILPDGVACKRHRCLSSAELGKVFGRESIIYMGVKKGPWAKKVSSAAQKLERIRDLDGTQS